MQTKGGWKSSGRIHGANGVGDEYEDEDVDEVAAGEGAENVAGGGGVGAPEEVEGEHWWTASWMVRVGLDLEGDDGGASFCR